MRNKELKVGDKVWLHEAYMSRLNGYTVKSVKKSKTLVTVVAEKEHPFRKDKFYEITLYGHCNSRILSGFDRVWSRDADFYTCDYDLIDAKSRIEKENHKLREAGRTLLKLSNYFK